MVSSYIKVADKLVSYMYLPCIMPIFFLSPDWWRMASGRMWLQIGISGWLTGDYSLRCQPVDYSDSPEVLRVGELPWLTELLPFDLFMFVFVSNFMKCLTKPVNSKFDSNEENMIFMIYYWMMLNALIRAALTLHWRILIRILGIFFPLN